MVEHVLDQLPPDTRQTVQTILVPPDPADPTQEKQAPSMSLAKLEQTWSALWQEWDHIVDEAAQEDGNYVVRERHWEEPYFDSTTFVRDLERVAKEMRPLLRTAFDKAFVPATRCPFHKFAASPVAARLYGLGGYKVRSNRWGRELNQARP